MANTANFGWETPDDTDLVKDGALAMRTLGNAIDASLIDLKGGTTNQVLAKNSNTDMDFKWVTDATGMTNPMTTTGDIIYSSSGSTPARLGIGSTGNVLTVAGGVPVWSAPAGGGKVLQVVSTTKSDTFSSSSTTLTDITGMSVTITPSSTASKIYIMYTLSAQAVTGSSVFVSLLLRGSTAIARGDAAGSRTRVTTPNIRETDTAAMGSAVGLFLDSPATTSATTYKIQGRGTGGTWYINTYASDSDSADAFRSISTITAWEIGA